MRPIHRIQVRGEALVLGEKTWVMGALNVTPDSFSDGGRFASTEAAVARGLALFETGADVVDIGGESTRPASRRVELEEELRRVVPVVEGLRRRCDGLVSIDTSKVAVARAALDAGADLVNDVSGFRFEPAMAGLVAERRVPAVLMHLRGEFESMHREPCYADVVGEVREELGERLASAAAAGVEPAQLLLDPGIGFSKDASHSLALVAHLAELHALARPLVVGPSRKSFIGRVLELPVGERLLGTAAAVAACVLAGAHVVRVHDVAEMLQVTRLCDALLAAGAADAGVTALATGAARC